MRTSKTSENNVVQVMALLSEKLEQMAELVSRMEMLEQKLKVCSTMWLTVDQLIEYLPTHPAKKTLYSMINHGKIPHYLKARDYFFLRSEIDAWLEQGYFPVRKSPEERAEEYIKEHPGRKR